VSTTSETIEQFCYFVDAKERVPLLKALLDEKNVRRCIVFTRMKHVANRLAEKLVESGVSAEPFHSNKSQAARQRALQSFKDGKCRILVATDIAARGLDVDEVEVVVNYDLPDVPETYVHRIGRAGRAGRTGLAWSLVDEEQRALLHDIERTTKCRVKVVEEHPFATDVTRDLARAFEDVRAGRAKPPRAVNPIQRAMQEGREHRKNLQKERSQGGQGGGQGRGGHGRGAQSRDGGQGRGVQGREGASAPRAPREATAASQPRSPQPRSPQPSRRDDAPRAAASSRGDGPRRDNRDRGGPSREPRSPREASGSPTGFSEGNDPRRPSVARGTDGRSLHGNDPRRPLPDARNPQRPTTGGQGGHGVSRARQVGHSGSGSGNATTANATNSEGGFGIRQESSADLRAQFQTSTLKPAAAAPVQAAEAENAGDKPKRRFAFWKKD
jgi:superfamily II DNA/RNA helicase